ncbi:helix-turn-helix domain-containing protein [Bradyrhizobium stylosanthis]|uniref:helix-turn-helix domain-containing protein n=1 Tax=Bradyrhizobium stylosanthis TaxID=1803665 RepID=UPI001FDA27F7|nr:helix-turn-helix transcriptional regulator [Bradyrhizobium stylosanthis]
MSRVPPTHSGAGAELWESEEDLALEAGLDRTYISQVERGTRNWTIVVLARLARALQTTPDQLLVPEKKSRG